SSATTRPAAAASSTRSVPSTGVAPSTERSASPTEITSERYRAPSAHATHGGLPSRLGLGGSPCPARAIARSPPPPPPPTLPPRPPPSRLGPDRFAAAAPAAWCGADRAQLRRGRAAPGPRPPRDRPRPARSWRLRLGVALRP